MATKSQDKHDQTKKKAVANVDAYIHTKRGYEEGKLKIKKQLTNQGYS